MHKFKVGDRVVGNSNHDIEHRRGDTGIVDMLVYSGLYLVTWDSNSETHACRGDEINLIEEKPTVDIHNTQKKTWSEMTPEEKGALLLAHHEGKEIQVYTVNSWQTISGYTPKWFHDITYRVKPNSVIKTVEVWLRKVHHDECTERRIGTIQTVDGEPDWSTIKGETL